VATATVVVTGVHREELAFGDRVADRLDPEGVDILRIPEGVPQRCTDVDQQFRHEARQRELYLQLHRQVKGRYGLLIDLHSGVDENGPGADVYCHDSNLLECLRSDLDPTLSVRLIRIIAPDDPIPDPGDDGVAETGARTCIPSSVWNGGQPLYVGLEVYLRDAEAGRDAESLAERLIGCIQACANRV
jgi:hypothetical protein